MRYFVGFHVKGQGGKVRDEISDALAAQFKMRSLRQSKPAHMTIVPPFESDDVSALEFKIEDLVARYHSLPIKLSGFGHFNKRVLYIVAHLPDETRRAFDEISRVLNHAPFDATPHVTVGYCDTPAHFPLMWQFLQTLNSQAECVLDNVTIFARSEKMWQVHREFVIPLETRYL